MWGSASSRLGLFSRHKALTSCVPTAGGKAHLIWRLVLASGPVLTGRLAARVTLS